VVRDNDRPTAAVASDDVTDPIPVVDLNRLSAGAADEAAKLSYALQNWGLFMARKLTTPSINSASSSIR
jgi:hypothetical protein